MFVRKTIKEDINELLDIYNSAVEFMKSVGNSNQWINGYPGINEINKDIDNNHLYTVLEDDEIVGCFALIIGVDNTYLNIDGKWLNDELYATIHRIASKRGKHGVFKAACDFAFSLVDNVRIDTHEDNVPMKSAILKEGFSYCGIIICHNGTPRLAYQKKFTSYVDTHVHLNDSTIESHLDEVINDAFLKGVKKMIVVGWDKLSSLKALELSRKYPWCYCMLGFHPCNVKGLTEEDYIWLEENAKDSKCVAIGEIGYDFHWDDTTPEEQEVAFIRQIEIAKRINKPISIHSRDAHQKTFDTVKESGASIVGGVLHSYSGSSEMAKEYIKLNFIFGISGPVTFKNGRNMKEIVENIVLKYIISETDSPYLTPSPYRGTENGPKNIPLIVDEIADLKNMRVEDVKKQILENVERVFKI